MKETLTQVERRLQRAIAESTPDVLPQILSRIAEEGEKDEMQNKIVQPRFKTYKKWVGLAAAVVVVCAAMFGFNYYTPETTIGFDVNPSIELKVNRMEKVLSATALNDEANVILDNMQLKNVDLDIAINALIGSMVKNGYIDDIKNSILISVDGKDETRALQLQVRLSGEVGALLDGYAVQGSVMSQTLPADKRIEALAKEHNVSTGKAALVDKLVQQDGTLDFQELSALSINEINLLLDSRELTGQAVASSGTASTTAYLGEERAKNIAYTHSGVAASSVQSVKIKMDYEHGQMVYEVKFKTALAEYEYEINATSGAIVEYSVENKNAYTAPQAAGETIGEAKAQTIAMESAGFRAEDTVVSSWKLERDNGRVFYEVKLLCGNEEYKCDIDAVTGEILKSKRTARGGVAGSTQAIAGANWIDEALARSNAYKHAGVPAENVALLKEKLGYYNGLPVYELEFVSDGRKYEYLIDAADGSVVKSESKSYSGGAASAGGQDYIGGERAKAAALAHAGIAPGDVTSLKIKQDRDDGRVIYEVEFSSGGVKYEYDIDALTGSVIAYKTKTASGTQSSVGSESYIGEERAKSTAFAHAGVTAEAGTSLKVKLENKHGRAQYQVKFKSSGKEYDYEIDAVTGAIIEFEVEND